MARSTRSSTHLNAPAIAALRRQVGLFAFVALFSACVSVLMLAGPLYMLNIYDKVIPTGSVPTLIALSGILAFVFVVTGVLDYVRGRLLNRAADNVRTELRAQLLAPRRDHRQHHTQIAALTQALESPAALALFDLACAPVYFIALFGFHPLLGALALGGALLVVLITWAGRALSADSARMAAAANRDLERQESELAQSALWPLQARFLHAEMHDAAMGQRQAKLRAGDRVAQASAITRGLRHMLQSASLGLGAWLVIQDQMSAGAIFAGSLLMGRAMGPVDAVMSQWQLLRTGYGALRTPTAPPQSAVTIAPPEGALRIRDLSFVPPHSRSPTLRMVQLTARPGEVVGVWGGSGAGKSTLMRAITGQIAPTGGEARLGPSSLRRLFLSTNPAVAMIDECPALIEGTLIENIAGDPREADAQRLAAAIAQSGLQRLCARSEDGLDLAIKSQGSLSLGERRRIALARAIYAQPYLLAIDGIAPGLDPSQIDALAEARRRAGLVTVIADQSSATLMGCDRLVALADGAVVANAPPQRVMDQIESQRARA